MSKYKEGQKCRIVKNLLAPSCVGQTVTILGVAIENGSAVLYRVREDEIDGYAMETCLEPLNE